MRERCLVVAIDLGAESGRVVDAMLDGGQISLEVCHRFPNGPLRVRDRLYWDILRLWGEVQAGLDSSLSRNPASIGIDTWAVDFALLDRGGHMLGNPVHYRDARTEGMLERAYQLLPRPQIFEHTGIQFMPLNSLYQLLSMVESRDPALQMAETFLTIPDLLNYWMTGEKVCEFTNATTTQCYDPRLEDWAYPLLDCMGIPSKIFPQIVQPGTRLGVYESVPVIAPACHDTGSAIAAVPVQEKNFAYLSSGTWSLLGLETQHPVIGPATLGANITNEGGVYGTFRLLKNIMGLWLLQQCRSTWAAEGKSFDYPTLNELAREARPFGVLVDPDDPSFFPPGDMPARIDAFCARTGQAPPEGISAVVRCILESLALKYRLTLDLLVGVCGQGVDVLHIIGGGSQNDQLCQMTANATGKPVVAGPVEATALGNALVQWIALGEIGSLAEGREIVRSSFALKTYQPTDIDAWEAALEKFKRLLNGQ